MHPDEEQKLDAFVWHATAADRFADALHPEGKWAELSAYMDKQIEGACGLSYSMLGKP